VVPLATSQGIVVSSGTASQNSAPGADVSIGLQLAAAQGSGSASFTMAPQWNSAAIDLDWSIDCVALSYTQSVSSGLTRHELFAARQVPGRFVITWTVTTTGTGAATLAFDLGDDGVVEATNSAVIAHTLPVGVTVFSVDLDGQAAAGVVSGPWGAQYPYHGTVSAQLTVRFEPTHCSSVPYGGACGVAIDAVGNFSGGADLAAQVPLADLAIAVLGLDQVTTTLPLAPGCTLVTTPVGNLLQVPNGGEAAWSIGLPPGIGPVVFSAQAVGFDVSMGRAEASHGLRITCQ